MSRWRSIYACARTRACVALFAATVLVAASANAATIQVSAGGDLQAAINSAQAGDTILLQPGATFVGNFTLPVHAGTDYITIRSAASDDVLPAAGARINPSYAAYLPKIRSGNSGPAIRTAPSAAYWRLMDLELQANYRGYNDILTLGDGSSAQNDLSLVPHHLIVDRLYIHGDPVDGQKRGIALNSGNTIIANSYVSDIKAIGQDSQAVGGWNGSGPYRIENNYLESSTENVMFGGDDPKIAGLTPTGIIIRGNTITKPVSWKNPIVPAPANVRPSASTGALLAGTYGYKVVARAAISNTTAKSAPSAEVTVTVGAGSRISLTWDAVSGAKDYVVYGRTPGAEAMYWVVTSPAFADDGTLAGTAGTPSTSGTVWQVKNLLEVKNVDHVQVDHNLLENVWQQAQMGYAVLFTPRNQYGSCTWCVVQNVTFEDNVVRHMAGGFQILGRDDVNPSQQTNTIVIRNNELSDINRSLWGGDGWFAQLTSSPRDVTIDHNTIISPNGKGVIAVGNGTVDGFTFTNNLARHNSYGIFGDNEGSGNTAINYYLPGSVITANVLAGGKASIYPAGNLFPTTTDFQTHFVDYAGGNYALNAGTDWAGAGTDGLDLGAAYPVLGTVAEASFTAVQLTTGSLPSTTEGDVYSSTLAAAGGVLPYGWSIAAGTLPGGLALDAVSGTIGGSATLAGDYSFSARVTDATGMTSTQPLTIHVDKYIPPVQIVTTTLPNAVATVPYAQSLVASGGTGAYVWSVSGGALPAGLALAANGVLSGTTVQPGTFVLTATATDASDATRYASGSLALSVAPPPNIPPTVSMSSPASGAVAQVGSTLTLAANASDADGTVQRVDFYVGSALVGSSAGPTFSMPWVVSAPGSYQFTAVAVDNAGAATTSSPATISTQSEVVLYASQVVSMVGNYKLSATAGAAGGYVLANPNQYAAKVTVPLASPTSYADFTFYAQAGRAYRLWIRGFSHNNDSYNDSAWFQFDDVSNALIGTTSGFAVNLEDCSGCGLSGFGWQDDGYGAGVLGPLVYFNHTGVQRIRIQPREDGFNIDQIVLSPEKYLSTAPGALKNDTTILPGSGNAAGSVATLSLATSPSTTTATAATTPSWTSVDIGTVSPAGSAVVSSSGVFTVAGAGDDIWGNADSFHFYYQPLTGDGQIVARVASVQNIRSWTKAAVMMRDTVSSGAAHAMMLVSAAKGTAFQRRTVANGVSTSTAGPAVSGSYWVRLARAGTTFTASASADGVDWTTVGSESIVMGATIDVGLAVDSHANGTLATATFDHVSVTQN